MKNLHLIPTDKPTRLYEDVDCDLRLGYDFIHRQGMLQNQHIYITSDEEIKEGDWCYAILSKQVFKNTNPNLKSEDKKKIILTTDQDLIEDGVQAIDDDFLEWFVENPSCEEVEIRKEKLILGEVAGTTYTDFNYKIIIPQEEIIADKDVKDFSDKFTEGYNRVVPKHLREDKPVDKEKEKSFGDWVQTLRDRLGWNKEFKDDFFGKQEPKQETLEPIVYNIGDNIRIINPTENQPKLFTTHKVDNNFGVVYYYQLDGKEESIGFSYIKKEEPKQFKKNGGVKMTIAQQLNITTFPFEIKDNEGRKIYREESDGCWVKFEYDQNGNEIYCEDNYGIIRDNRPKPEPAKKQPAVEWLEKEISTKLGTNDLLDDLYKQAKAMEKEQAINFTKDFIDEHTTGDYDGKVQLLKPIEQYFNEIYGGDK